MYSIPSIWDLYQHRHNMKCLIIFCILLLCSCSNRDKSIVAEVNGHEVYASELSQLTTQETFDLLNTAYEIKMKALEDLIKQKLIEQEASVAGKTFETFLNDYVEKVISIKEDSLLAVYGSVNERVLLSRERLSKVSSESIEGVISLKNDVRAALIQHLADSLYNKAEVKRYLYPPKQPKCIVSDLNVRYRGNLNAATTFIVASDFDCKRCIDFEKTLRRIYDEYKDRVKFGFINFADEPTLASLSCEAAAKYGKFWEFHDAIFEHEALVDSSFIFNIATNSGLDLKAYKKELLSAPNYDKVNHAINKLMERGLFATPTIIINDRLVYITNSYEELTKLLNQELQNR